MATSPARRPSSRRPSAANRCRRPRIRRRKISSICPANNSIRSTRTTSRFLTNSTRSFSTSRRRPPIRSRWASSPRSASKRVSRSRPTSGCAGCCAKVWPLATRRRAPSHFANRDRSVYYYPDRQWYASFAGAHDFIENGVLSIDKRVLWHYSATGVTPAMSTPQEGTGSVYPMVCRDADGN